MDRKKMIESDIRWAQNKIRELKHRLEFERRKLSDQRTLVEGLESDLCFVENGLAKCESNLVKMELNE